MKAKVTAARWSIDESGAWVSFRTEAPADARAMCDTLEADREYTVELKRHFQKRSKNANDLLWELCTQLAERLSKYGLVISKETIYRQHIKEAGRCDYVACMERAADTLIAAWQERGIGWFVEKVDDCKVPGCVKLCLYYGSSTYTTAEMSRLLDSVVQQCNDFGIQVMSERELSLIKEAWT